MNHKLLCAVLLLLGIAEIIVCVETDDEIQKTLDFLQNGEGHMKLEQQYRDVVMMVGNTGTGKSTLVRFIAGNLTELQSVKKGAFVIEYLQEGIIGNSTTRSQTIYPDLVVDEENVAFYDCPGFSDTRNISIEIATTYFTKKVVDHAENLKFILVVNYNDIIIGGSRTQFPALIKNLKYFIRNLSEYKTSIGLVATKVPNEYDTEVDPPAPIPDEGIKENIADFLREVRTDLEGNKEATDTELNEYSIKLIDILLAKGPNGIYEKLSIFRKPTKAGNLNNIPAMVNGRRIIRQMILKQVAYSPKIANNFGYTLSDTSKVKLIQLTNGINRKIQGNMAKVGIEIENGIESFATHNGDLLTLANLFHNAHGNLSAIVNDAHDNTTIIPNLKRMSNTFNFHIPNDNFKSIENQINYINFLQSFTSEPLPADSNVWLRSLNNCTHYLEENQNWYMFLKGIYDEYSQYEIRRELDKYNVANMDDWGHADRPLGISVNRNNFGKFLDKQKSSLSIKNLRPSESQLQTLNTVLEITLKQQPILSCENDSTILVVKGDYVRSADVNLLYCGDRLKEVYLFALHTVFIDRDINIPQDVNLIVFAQKWYILGERKIKLAGFDGRDLVGRANNGHYLNTQAPAGSPGLPGGNSGSFVGLGIDFINGDRLSIEAIGGHGGRGQDGGNGYSQSTPLLQIESPSESIGADENALKQLNKVTRLRFISEDCWTGFTIGIIGNRFCDRLYWLQYDCNGAGGDGGAGGLGGLAGHQTFYELNDKSKINFVKRSGSTGANGIGGSTSYTSMRKVKHEIRKDRFFETNSLGVGTFANVFDLDEIATDFSCPTSDGRDGGNSNNIIRQKPVNEINFAPALRKCMAYIRAQQMIPIKRNSLIYFAEKIVSNSQLNAAIR